MAHPEDMRQPTQKTTSVGPIPTLLSAASFALGVFIAARSLRLKREAEEHLREKELNDRFSKAIEQLVSRRPFEQLGGIYALEGIMLDSERIQPTVVELLAAFVRENAPVSAGGADDHLDQRVRPTEPVKAALIVLGRRPKRNEPFRVDLRRTDLRGAYLEYARLEGANLGASRLEGAFLEGCQLQGAWLGDTCMHEADLEEVNLEGADLYGADMKRAKNLTLNQVLAARPTHWTQLPPDLSPDDHQDLERRMSAVEHNEVPVHFLRACADGREILPLGEMDEARQRWLEAVN
ncbi:pentapeptide repeat-containing protein [Streptomyces sp. CA-210063]|uniref:pentapeptide repeat-containing protein n=1 Tax=Streptomyces sp. CA-210063 TaxID=2801029 RepID=UPI00214C327E|nr:pentapeptide repeat-containing protein [Streptomyces sp. CA-210063]UUU31997.1 pentapeptide repeat-containing protein [Streptomyces sp. CA-210063]